MSGSDLIHGTPVIDIKPYFKDDSLDTSISPEWLLASQTKNRLSVKFSDSAIYELSSLLPLDFYSTLPEIKSVICESLELNPHSVYFISTDKEGIYAIALDYLKIK